MGKLKGVADTLYIPLTARINISKRFPDFFYDEKALELEKEQVKQIIGRITEAFENVEIVFDAMSSKAINYANKYVRRTGSRSAAMHFFTDDPRELARECNVEFVEALPFITEARRKLGRKLKVFTRIAMKVVDEGGRKGYIIRFASQRRNQNLQMNPKLIKSCT